MGLGDAEDTMHALMAGGSARSRVGARGATSTLWSLQRRCRSWVPERSCSTALIATAGVQPTPYVALYFPVL